MKLTIMAYSIICYITGLAALVYLILFIGDLIVPWTINSKSPVAPEITGVAALIWNSALVAVWGAQHSMMANPVFKKYWTKVVPPSVERSTYLLVVALMTVMLIVLWAPLPAQIWDISDSFLGSILMMGFFAGWAIVLISTFLINHWHLFGLEQAWRFIRQRPMKQASFVTPFFYKLVRHPMMTGVLISLWCAPAFSVGRLLFNTAMTVYILVGTRHEEKNLATDLGTEYENYRKKVPMFIPGTSAN